MIRNLALRLCLIGAATFAAPGGASGRERAEAAARSADQLAAAPTIRDCPDVCPEMALVPAGEFRMGSPIDEDGRDHQEGPMHRVRIAQPFFVGRYDVTVGEFAAFVKETGHDAGACGGKPDTNWKNPGYPLDDAGPVVCVNFADTQAYAAWLSKKTGHAYRLLSEAEYEYINRAGTRTAYWWGPKVGVNHANCAACGSAWDGKRTAPMGSFPPNPFGLYDTTGNVYVWVADCWNDIYDNAPADGSANTKGDCTQRGLRGGGFGSGVPHVMAGASASFQAARR